MREARPWSRSAPATISEALALFLFTSMTIGTWLPGRAVSLSWARYTLLLPGALPLVDTITPSPRKRSETFIAWSSSPPPLSLRSIISAFIPFFFSPLMAASRSSAVSLLNVSTLT